MSAASATCRGPRRILGAAGHRAVIVAHALRKIAQDFVRQLEREIVQQDHDLLLVARRILGIAHDQRRRHQRLLLQQVMRMHPVGARQRDGEVVVVAFARRERRLGDAGHAVLVVGRRQAVPVDQRRLLHRVAEPHPEPLAGIHDEAMRAIGLQQPEHLGGLALHLDGAGGDRELDRAGVGGGARGRREGRSTRAAPVARKRRRDRRIMLET